jgi:methionyl-tRNA synthetase
MVEKYCDGVVPAGASTGLDTSDRADFEAYHAAMDGGHGYLLHEGLKAVWQSVGRGNEFVDRQAPWKLAKDPLTRPQLESTLAALCRHLARHCVVLHPFMPGKAAELWQSLGGKGDPGDCRFAGLFDLDVTGWRVSKGPSLFPKEAA